MTKQPKKTQLKRQRELLERWASLYDDFEPGDPGLADAAQEILDQLQSLDGEVCQDLKSKDLNYGWKDQEIEALQGQCETILLKIHKRHLKYSEGIALERQRILAEMSKMRKSKNLTARMNSEKSAALAQLDAEA